MQPFDMMLTYLYKLIALIAGSQVLSAFTNIPLDRVVRKYNNLDRAFQKDTETWESTAMILGWSEWEVMGPPPKKEKKKKKKKWNF